MYTFKFYEVYFIIMVGKRRLEEGLVRKTSWLPEKWFVGSKNISEQIRFWCTLGRNKGIPNDSKGIQDTRENQEKLLIKYKWIANFFSDNEEEIFDACDISAEQGQMLDDIIFGAKEL